MFAMIRDFTLVFTQIIIINSSFLLAYVINDLADYVAPFYTLRFHYLTILFDFSQPINFVSFPQLTPSRPSVVVVDIY